MGKAVAREISKHSAWECIPFFFPQADVIIDFSAPSAIDEYLSLAIQHQKPVVIGTTGLTSKEQEMISLASRSLPLFYSPNFSKGIFFLAQFAQTLSKQGIKKISISETHHTSKKDKPSGTALHLFEKMKPHHFDICVQSFRKKDLVGIHSLTFEWEGEEITLEHRAHSRSIYAKGAVEAALWLKDQPVGYYTMEYFLCTLSI